MNELKKNKGIVQHHFVSKDQRQGLRKLADGLVGPQKVITASVPGTPAKYDVPADCARIATCQLTWFFVCLNYLGWSFDGNIDPNSMYVAPPDRVVMEEEMMDRLLVSEDRLECKDAKQIAFIIRTVIFESEKLPVDIEHLVELLEGFKPSLRLAIILHPSLLTEIEKIRQFGILFELLMEIKVSDPTKFNRIITKIPFCNVSRDHWKFRAHTNIYLEKILMHVKNKGNVFSAAPYRYHTRDLVRMERALTNNRVLFNFMTPDFSNYVNKSIKTLSAHERNLVSKDDEKDLATILEAMLDDLLTTGYQHDGESFLRDIRNCDQHLFRSHALVAPPHPPAATGVPSRKPGSSSGQQSVSSQAPVMSPAHAIAMVLGWTRLRMHSLEQTLPSARLVTQSVLGKRPAPPGGTAPTIVSKKPNTGAVTGSITSAPQQTGRTLTTPVTRSTIGPQTSAASFQTAVPITAPVPQAPPFFEYFQVEHIVGAANPGVRCAFFMAMHDEGLLYSIIDKSLTDLFYP